MADEAAADAKYKDKELWIIEAMVNSYTESESGNYLKIQGQQISEANSECTWWGTLFTLSTIELNPQIAKDFDFKDVAKGCLVDIIGKYRYMSIEKARIIDLAGREIAVYDPWDKAISPQLDVRLIHAKILIVEIDRIVSFSGGAIIPQPVGW